MRYVAFLRAINVGGHVVKMDALRRSFEALSLQDVSTFIASGNVVFTSAAKAGALEALVERRLRGELGYEVATFVRSVDEVRAIAGHEPFDPAELRAGADVFVGFLKVAPGAAAKKALLALRNPIDDVVVRGRELYWLRRRQLGESIVSGSRVEKAGVVATFRGMSTVRKIAEKHASLTARPAR